MQTKRSRSQEHQRPRGIAPVFNSADREDENELNRTGRWPRSESSGHLGKSDVPLQIKSAVIESLLHVRDKLSADEWRNRDSVELMSKVDTVLVRKHFID